MPAGDIKTHERIWDPLVRLTHWSIAIAVLLNGLIVEDDSVVHIWIGYTALAMLALRLIWGLIGTDEARFSAFPPSPAAAIGHVADILAGRRRRHRSHNPLGALMVYALWATLLVVSLTGIAMQSSPFPTEDSAYYQMAEREHDHEEEGEDVMEEIHETAANLLLLLAALHVAGVALESRLSGDNLVRAMLTGKRHRAKP